MMIAPMSALRANVLHPENWHLSQSAHSSHWKSS
jgi:hypothetical protein